MSYEEESAYDGYHEPADRPIVREVLVKDASSFVIMYTFGEEMPGVPEIEVHDRVIADAALGRVARLQVCNQPEPVVV